MQGSAACTRVSEQRGLGLWARVLVLSPKEPVKGVAGRSDAGNERGFLPLATGRRGFHGDGRQEKTEVEWVWERDGELASRCGDAGAWAWSSGPSSSDGRSEGDILGIVRAQLLFGVSRPSPYPLPPRSQ